MWWIYIIIGGIALLVLILLVWAIVARNSIKAARLKIEEAGSNIDVALIKRYDVLTKVLDVVKGFIKYEKEVLFEVIHLRKGMTSEERAIALQNMEELGRNINLLAEAYPDLRSSDLFLRLQRSISDTEEHLQAARRLYNSSISFFNRKLVVFPSSLMGKIMKQKSIDFIEAEEYKRNDIEIKF